MKNFFILIVLLMPLWTLSQTTSLTPEQKRRVTKIFTADKILDVSKAIDNEKRKEMEIIQLQDKIDSLKVLAQKKDVLIDSFTSEIITLNNFIRELSKEEDEVADEQLKNAKKPFLGLHLNAGILSRELTSDLSLQVDLSYKLDKFSVGFRSWSRDVGITYGPYVNYKFF